MNNEVSLKFVNSVTGDKKLEKYAEHLNLVASALNAMDKGKLDILGKASNEMKNATIQKEKLNKKIDFGINMVGLSKLKNLLQSATNTISKLSKKSAEYIENVNLLEVAYANTNEKIEESSERIETFIRKMSEVYGFDESRLTRQFGIFKQLANAMKLPTETAENLSELMVKMSNDIASLYNLDLDRASNALQSALAGQVRPIRSATGADITEKTLQNTVDALGLDTTINQLSYVEKRLIMVISLTEQLKKSQGDYGRTIESVANQMKVLHEQWDRLTRAVGNVFYPLIQSILPYLNGIIMALTEIFNMIASLLGFEMPSFDYSGLAGTSDAVADLEDELNGASAGADKLSKKLSGLRGFDKLNVISTPKNSGASAGGGTGINKKILDAFTSTFSSYDDMLGKVRMKANDIRDSIMKWLGFTKEINPLTGEVEWKYEGIGKTFSNIWDSIKNLSPSMKILTAGIGLLVASKTISAIGNVVGLFQKLTGWTNSAGETLKGFNKTNIEYWNKNTTLVQKFTRALVGAGGLYVGFQLISSGMDEINEKGLTLTGTFQVLGGTMSNVFGGAMIGSVFGPPGAIIGGFAGLIISLIEATSNYKNEFDKLAESTEKSLEPIKQYNDELQRQYDIIDENAKQQNLTVAIHQGLFDELQKITDENGRVHSGYEKRAEFIITELNKAYGLEIQMVDGVIQEYDKQKKSIQELIDQKRIEIATEIAGEKYKIAIQEQTKAYNNLTKAKEAHSKATQDVADFETKLSEIWEKDDGFLKNMYGTFDNFISKQKESNETYKALITAEKNAQKEMENSQKSYKKTQEAILVYNNVVTSAYENNVEEVEYWMNKLLDDYDQETDIYTKLAKEAEESYRQRKEIAIESGEEINEAEELLFNEKYNTLVNQLKKEKDAINDNEDDYVRAWAMVATHSKDIFLENFGELPKDVQQKVVNKMYDLGYNISDELQQGISRINPEIKFKTNLPDVSTKVNQWVSDFNKSSVGKSDLLNIGGSRVFATPYKYSTNALGGMPPVGQLFVANEKGPELVGQIGGKTFVANQNQMMELLDKKISGSQSKGTQVINLYLDADHKIGSYTMEQLQNMAKTDGKPITIGG